MRRVLHPWWSSLLGASGALLVGSVHAQSADPAPAPGAEKLDTIVVNASADASAGGLKAPYAGGQVARGGRVGLFGSLDLMETPFTITSYTQKLIQDQQAASIADVLQNDPAVRVARGFGNFQQTYLVRGLPIFSDDLSYNGLYGLLPRQYLAAELVERVEVLRGASAFLNGAAPGGSGLGGAINVMPKRATNEALTEGTVGAQSGPQGYAAFDVARRFGVDRSLGLRLNGVRRDGDTSIDGERRTLSAVSVGADYRGSDARVSADLGYQNHHLDRSQPSVTIAPGLAIPSAPEASRNLGQPWTFSNERDTFGTVRAEVDLTSRVTLWAAAGMRTGHESAIFANPTVVAANGAMSAYRFDNTRKDDIATGELGARGTFAIAGMTHNVVASLATYSAKSKNAYAFSNFAGFDSNLHDPVTLAAPPANFFTGGVLKAPRLTDRTRTSSAALADRVAFLDDRLLLSLGARYQRIESTSYDYNDGSQLSNYAAGRITPVGGLVFRIDRRVALYANYIEGLVKGDTAPDTFTDATGATRAVTNAGKVFQPYQSKQQEVGVKLDTGSLGGSIGVFSTRKPIASVDATSGHYAIIDQQKNRGVELSAYGELVRGVRVLGGASWLDADVSGKDAIGSPQSQYNLGLEWDLPWVDGLSVDARGVHTASQFADAANTQRVPAWSRVDVGARWQVDIANRPVTLRARVDNLTNRNQWVSVGGYPGAGYLVLGTPRTFTASASLAF